MDDAFSRLMNRIPAGRDVILYFYSKESDFP